MPNPILQVFENQTANGNSTEFFTDGETQIIVQGTFDGAVFTLQSDPKEGDSANWESTGDVITQATDPSDVLTHTPNVGFRFNLSNAGGSTDLTVYVVNGKSAN